MDRKLAEDFVKKNRSCDHGHVVWIDGQDDEFGITLRVETVMEYLHRMSILRQWP